MIIKGRNVRAFPTALGCVVVVGLSGLALSILPASASAGPAAGTSLAAEEAAVRKAFTEALVVHRELGAPSASAGRVPRPLSAEKSDRAAAVRAGVPAVAEREGRKARDRKDIDRLFGSAKMKAQENQTVDNTLAAVADPNFRFLAQGASAVAITSVKVTGNTATIEATATIWSKFEEKRADGTWESASPANDMVYNATLAIGPAGTWTVTDLVGDFTNGNTAP